MWSKSVSAVDLGIVMKIDGVPEGFEIRTVYDAQGLADACVSGQKLQPGERVVCAIIRPVSGEDFVIQDQVPARKGIDERRFLYESEHYIGVWQAVGNYSRGMMHGEMVEGDRVEIRCRRKDLPHGTESKRG